MNPQGKKDGFGSGERLMKRRVKVVVRRERR